VFLTVDEAYSSLNVLNSPIEKVYGRVEECHDFQTELELAVVDCDSTQS
jgi:hypothetical protein